MIPTMLDLPRRTLRKGCRAEAVGNVPNLVVSPRKSVVLVTCTHVNMTSHSAHWCVAMLWYYDSSPEVIVGVV